MFKPIVVFTSWIIYPWYKFAMGNKSLWYILPMWKFCHNSCLQHGNTVCPTPFLNTSNVSRMDKQFAQPFFVKTLWMWAEWSNSLPNPILSRHFKCEQNGQTVCPVCKLYCHAVNVICDISTWIKCPSSSCFKWKTCIVDIHNQTV